MPSTGDVITFLRITKRNIVRWNDLQSFYFSLVYFDVHMLYWMLIN